MVEVLVAMTVLAVLCLSILATLTATQRTAFANRGRVAGAALAASEMDRLRAAASEGVRALPIDLGDQVRTVTQAGTTYSVTTRVDHVTAADQTSACSSPVGQRPWEFVKVNVNVTWPGMGPVPPVVSDAVITPGLDDRRTAPGIVVATVRNREGAPQPDVPVTLTSGQHATTGPEGCVVITGVSPGPNDVMAGGPGWLSPAETARPKQGVFVSASTTSSVEFVLDKPARLQFTDPASATHPLPGTSYQAAPGSSALQPAPQRISLSNTDMPGGTKVVDRSGPTTTVENLFPHAAGYQLNAGPCATTGSAGATVVARAEPGKTTTVAVPYAKVAVTVTGTGTSPSPRAVDVYGYLPGAAGCPAQQVKLGEVPGSRTTVLRNSLVSGPWQFFATGRGTSTPASDRPSSVLDAGAASETLVTLRVSP